MAYFLSPFGNTQAFDANGDPLVGGSWRTFLAGTTTPETTYTSQAGAVAQGVQMDLDALGLPENGPVWIKGGIPLKFRLYDASGTLMDEWDDISGIGDVTSSVTQYEATGFVPTYISATSFSVTGDKTNTFQTRRKLETLNNGGLVYSRVESSSFGAGVTTVTVTNQSGVLDVGLSTVAASFLTDTPSAIPESDLGLAFRVAKNLYSLPPMTVYGGAATRMAIGTGLNANILATTTPIRLSFPGGIGANGRIDYPGSITADASAFWATLTASSTLYTFYDRNTTTGAITGVFSTLPYISQDSTVAVSVVSGQHTYVTDTNTMYVGNGSVATVVQRVPEGELVTSGVAVTSVTSYAKLRKFTQAWVTPLPAGSTQISANHNLGTKEYSARLQIECTTIDNGWQVGDRLTLLSGGLSGTNTPAININQLANSVQTPTANGATTFVMVIKGGGATFVPNNASWKYRFVITPDF